jgi:hypothetical protein
MTPQRKLTVLLMPFQAYCVLALLALLVCGAPQHAVNFRFVMFLAWSCVASSFLWLIGAAVQAHFRFVGIASINALLAIAALYAAGRLMPCLAK